MKFLTLSPIAALICCAACLAAEPSEASAPPSAAAFVRIADEAFAYEEFWPGSDYVDVLAADVYRSDWKQSHHDDLTKPANGKPIAIGEVAPPPNAKILESQGNWTWFMPWGNLVSWGNGVEIVKELFVSGKALAKEDVMIDGNGNYKVNRQK